MKTIDCHCHAFPPAVLRALERSGKSFGAIPTSPWSELERLAEMDACEIGCEILSCPHVFAIEPALLADACRATNDRFIEASAAYPERFACFVHLPLTDTEAALEELRRTRSSPFVRGVALPSNINGRYLDEPGFEPIWAELARTGTPAFIHPVDSPCYVDHEPPTLLSWPFDTTLAIVRLITRGLLDRYPNLILLISHLGGTLPFLGHRVDIGFAAKPSGWVCVDPPSTYLKKLYVDTALGWSAAAFACARAQFGIEHILFGTDHFNPKLSHMRKMVDFFATESFADGDVQRVLHANAEETLALSPS
jgi:predicted TIM-barrel fold metal-dependent hydrolase